MRTLKHEQFTVAKFGNSVRACPLRLHGGQQSHALSKRRSLRACPSSQVPPGRDQETLIYSNLRANWFICSLALGQYVLLAQDNEDLDSSRNNRLLGLKYERI